ncbi:hypothetical protein [Deinococcus peraridilitoris]|uniref:Uncharacterized protein n=1 Tax=Deinococcus peraridilitoris (strain DSM 19664 / LMG 22246 / CIP 109416 / KR-200) TaxID=937777 RepID=L0A2Q2_DEIPD|nr:hypothetical protein [Deinococcus peraridilitoris]AFZ67477.1 hypothetical protein Deipe_1976 [Deinococcus peraridilitoris DSM 19664]
MRTCAKRSGAYSLRKQSGVALVLVLLFTLVVLTTVLATAALAAQGARHGAGTDRKSYRPIRR